MRASALVKHVSPAIVIPGEEELELEPEPEPQLLLIPEPSITEGPEEKDLLIAYARRLGHCVLNCSLSKAKPRKW